MTQRSAERRNTGKRGAAQRRAKRAKGEETQEIDRLWRACLNPEISNEEVEWEMCTLGTFNCSFALRISVFPVPRTVFRV